jgi:BirA family biotin operon repressor/biotin-[acetyl-CoA-carboxylase] ligase
MSAAGPARPEAACDCRSALPAHIADALGRATPQLDGLGRDLHYFTEVGSTNDVAARLAADGAPEGTVVLAASQTAGRGRRGRSWHSPPGAGIYISLVLRPVTQSAGQGDGSLITLMAGGAAAEAVERAAGVVAALKWPNDLVVERRGPSGSERRKLAGILAEGSAVGGAISSVVLGIGINVRPSAHAPELAGIVTSLETERGGPVDEGAVVAELLMALARGRRDLLDGATHRVLERWRRYGASMLKRRVTFAGSEGPVDGIAEDIDDTGALIVATGRGQVRIVAGEVQWP